MCGGGLEDGGTAGGLPTVTTTPDADAGSWQAARVRLSLVSIRWLTTRLVKVLNSLGDLLVTPASGQVWFLP